jgi:hypothetical protein
MLLPMGAAFTMMSTVPICRHGIFAEKEPQHRHGGQQHPGTCRNADSQFHSSLCRILNTK